MNGSSLVAAGIAFFGLYLFRRHPLDPAALVSALSSVFLLIPMIVLVELEPGFLVYSTSLLLPYSWSSFPYPGAQWWVISLSACWNLGVFVSNRIPASPGLTPTVSRRSPSIGTISPPVLVLVGLTWAIVFILIFSSSGLTLLEFLSPIRKETSLIGGHFLAQLLILIPLSISLAFLASGKQRKTLSMFAFLIALVMAFSTAQRRSVLIVILLYGIFYLLYFSPTISFRRLTSKYRWRVFFIAGLMAPLIPTLWVARNIATGIFGEAFSFYQIERGAIELFFGSTATGFPVIVLITELLSESPYIYFAKSVFFLVSFPVPRAIWPTKPALADNFVSDSFGMNLSPSLFYVGEALLNFWVLAPVFLMLFAFALSRWSSFQLRSFVGTPYSTQRSRLTAVLMFSVVYAHSILLFKNGFTLFLVSTLVWIIALRLLLWFLLFARFRFH